MINKVVPEFALFDNDEFKACANAPARQSRFDIFFVYLQNCILVVRKTASLPSTGICSKAPLIYYYVGAVSLLHAKSNLVRLNV
jgi:hypothetical protein